MTLNLHPTTLPTSTFTPQLLTVAGSPTLVLANVALADELGIDAKWLTSTDTLKILAGNATWGETEPVATVYAGHQFGHWNPQLGDGRALLLGEHIQPNGKPVDIQLKGSGKTVYSRGGDGRSPLGPVIREYLVSDAMAALNIPTTRALAAVSTGDNVWRNEMLAGGILTRVASSHVRIGTLQYFAANQDHETLRALVIFCLQRHYPNAAMGENPALALLENAITAQANLIAQWQSVGFIHGVMNTDNMLLSGETIDYGPCAFMDAYNPSMVFSSIDHQGRYAYHNQPAIAHWNLAALADALIPILADAEETAAEIAQGAINRFPQQFQQAYYQQMLGKLGLPQTNDDNILLFTDLLDTMSKHAMDFTLTFRFLTEKILQRPSVATHFIQTNDFDTVLSTWLDRWDDRLNNSTMDHAEAAQLMQQHNPVFIPRNHLVEAAIAAAYSGDYALCKTTNRIWQTPYSTDLLNNEPDIKRWMLPPEPSERVYQTFCGT